MEKQMGQKVDFEELQKNKQEKVKDFEKLRKKRRRVQTGKRLIALCVIMGIVGGIVALNSFLISTGFTIRIGDIIESFGGAGYPVQIPGGVIRNVRGMGNDLAILNDTNLYILNSNGKVVTNLQRMNENTMMIPSGERVLTYAVGSRRYSIDTRSRNLIATESEYGILCGDLNERGDFAIAMASRQYVAQVTVYDRNAETLFGWASADNLVAGVALSPRGDRLAVSCINTQQGVLQTVLFIFDVNTQRELARVEYPDEMPLEVIFMDGDSIALLTDRYCRVIGSENGGTQHSYALPEGRLQAVERRGKEMLMLFSQPDTRTQRLVWLDENLNHVTSMIPQERIKDMALADRYAYILTDNGIVTLNRDFEQRREYSKRGINSIHLVRNRLYYFTQEEINTYSG